MIWNWTQSMKVAFKNAIPGLKSSPQGDAKNSTTEKPSAGAQQSPAADGATVTPPTQSSNGQLRMNENSQTGFFTDHLPITTSASKPPLMPTRTRSLLHLHQRPTPTPTPTATNPPNTPTAPSNPMNPNTTNATSTTPPACQEAVPNRKRACSREVRRKRPLTSSSISSPLRCPRRTPRVNRIRTSRRNWTRRCRISEFFPFLVLFCPFLVLGARLTRDGRCQFDCAEADFRACLERTVAFEECTFVQKVFPSKRVLELI